MDDREHMELMWENGRVLMRGLASSRSCTSYTPLPNKNVNEVKNNSDGYSTKRPWLGTGNNSILGDFPLIDDREPRDKYPQDDHHPELLSELCETSFNMFLENNENNNFEKNITDARVVPEYRNANWRPGNAFEFAAEVPQLSTASNGQLYQSFLEQQKASVPSFHGLPGSKLQQVDSEPDNRSRLQNYPPILRLAHRKPNQGSIAARSTSGTPGSSSRLWQLKSSTDEPPADLVESGQMVPTYASKVLKYFHDEQNLLASQIVPIAPIARPPEASPPDEQSEAGFHNYATTSKRCCDLVVGSTSGGGAEKTTKGKPDRGKSIDQLAATTSICSRGASNDPTPSSLERQYEDTEGTAYTSDDLEEEEQVPARGSAGSKRKRAAKIHILSERKRRDKINKKMRALQDLIPNSNKVDKASMLDEAIDYLKSLQLQVQIMSMATRPCMPAMMLPAAMQHMMIHAPLLAQFSAMGAAMDTRLMQMGAGCSPATFPASSMFGLPPGQMLPMSVSRAPPFFPLNIGGHSTHSSAPLPAMSGVAGAPNLEFLRSAVVFPSSKDMIYSNTSARK